MTLRATNPCVRTGSGAPRRCSRLLPTTARPPCTRCLRMRASVETKEQKPPEKTEAEVTTEKLGLEAGLFKVLTSKDEKGDSNGSRTEQARRLLTQYGSAYLLTSISLSIISFGLCYLGVDAGVDVAGLLSKVGIEVNTTNASVGTFALAYAAHKALSPVRFPPTVALTPVVAQALGQRKKEDGQ